MSAAIILILRDIVGRPGGRLALLMCLMLSELVPRSRLVRRCGRQHLHRGVPLCGGRGFLLKVCGATAGRQVMLMMGSNGILLHVWVQPLGIIVGVGHGNVTIPVAKLGARHG